MVIMMMIKVMIMMMIYKVILGRISFPLVNGGQPAVKWISSVFPVLGSLGVFDLKLILFYIKELLI